MSTITKHEQPDRFQIDVDGESAGFAQFVDVDDRRIFFHTEIDSKFEGQGLAGELVRSALDTTVAEGLRIVPVCPYVKAFVKKNEDWATSIERVSPADLAAIPR